MSAREHWESLSADDLASNLERFRSALAELKADIMAIEDVIVARSLSSDRTSRIRGLTRTIKVERPGPSWSQSDLRRLWENWEQADAYLRIESIGVKAKEADKLRRTSGELTEFERELLAAERPGGGRPKVTIER